MNPRVRAVLFTVGGAGLAIAIGADLADEKFALATLLALCSLWLIVAKVSPLPPDVWVLAGALIGYIVGNRGFAQMQPTANLPLLPAEAALLIAVPGYLFRVLFRRSPGPPKDLLNYSVLAWIAVGAMRLPLDINAFGVLALRDFAMIYYAAFFFIAQDFGRHLRSGRLLKQSLTVAFALLLPVVIAVYLAGDFLLAHFTWHGIPIIFHKSDLIATSLAAGFFWLWTRWDKTRNRLFLLGAASSLLLIALMASPRTGMFAVLVVTLLWLAVGRWRMAAAQVGIIGAAATIVVVLAVLTGKDLRTSAPYSMYEHAVSFFDLNGTRTYINGESGDLGGNNQFRLIWWRDVVEDTLTTQPALGQGFGSDLSTRFLADYDLLNDESFAARSPHSIIVTVIGRMGLVGLAAWLAVSVGIARLVWRLMKMPDPDAVGLASVVTVVWLSGCFGVVLEGPMGAVLFWTALGLANARAKESATDIARTSAGAVSAERPIAKPVPLDTPLSPR